MGIFGIQKVLMCTVILGGGPQKVYGLYTYENIDIYGQLLIPLYHQHDSIINQHTLLSYNIILLRHGLGE